MTLKLISFFLLSVITGGCQSVTIGDVEKKVIPAGQPGQPTVIQYSTTIMVAETVTVNSVEIVGASEKLSFVIYKLPDGLVMSTENELEPGKYYINITSIYKNELADTEEELLFNFIDASNKVLSIKKKSILKKL